LNAIHITSSAPCAANNSEFGLSRFELYSAALSALLWRKLNGKIKLVTDKTALKVYEKHNLASVWNEIDDSLPIKTKFDPATFWAGSKILALSKQTAPVVMLDTDFILWQKLDFNRKLICAHREDLFADVYPPLSHFKMNGAYKFNPNWNQNALPCNTAFLFIKDNDFLKYYTEKSLEFMSAALPTDDKLCYMVFAEQRLLAMCAEEKNQPIDALLDKDNIFDRRQNIATHIWGAKTLLRNSTEQHEILCKKFRERIRRDFKKYEFLIDSIETYKP